MSPDTQENAVNVVTVPEGAATSPTVAQLQAEIAAIKAKAALQVATSSAVVATATADVAKVTAKVAKQAVKKAKATLAKKNGKKAAKVKVAKDSAKADCTFEGGCDRKQIAKGLCPSHYRQLNRGEELKALRPIRGLVRLPMVIRVEQATFDLLEKRIKSGQANSMYDATRQALEAGVMTWGK